jgi:hypothetical protein
LSLKRLSGSRRKNKNPEFSRPYRAAEPFPHRFGSPRLAVGIRDGMSRRMRFWSATVRQARCGFISTDVRRGCPSGEGISHLHIVSRWQTAYAEHNVHTNRMLFREPNRIPTKILRNASVRPEESVPLLSRTTRRVQPCWFYKFRFGKNFFLTLTFYGAHNLAIQENGNVGQSPHGAQPANPKKRRTL